MVENFLPRLISKQMSRRETAPDNRAPAVRRGVGGFGLCVNQGQHALRSRQGGLNSLIRLANSLMGPENLREYSTKEDMFPRDTAAHVHQRTKETDQRQGKLLRKLTVGPVTEPKASAL